MSNLVEALQAQGFQKKIYEDQDGSPVFYTRSFNAKEIPEFALRFSHDGEGGDLGVITIEISEDGTLLQFCSSEDLNLSDAVNPKENPDNAAFMLSLFGIMIDAH